MPIIGRFKPFDEKVYTFRAKGLYLPRIRSTDTFGQKYRYFRFLPPEGWAEGGKENGRETASFPSHSISSRSLSPTDYFA